MDSAGSRQGDDIARAPRLGAQVAERLPTSIPAVTAAVVALLYTAGVLITASQLVASGLVVADVLPLVPIERLLARGASAGVYVPLVLPFFLVPAGYALWIDRSAAVLARDLSDDLDAIRSRAHAAREAGDTRAADQDLAQLENRLRARTRRLQRAKVPRAAVIGLACLGALISEPVGSVAVVLLACLFIYYRHEERLWPKLILGPCLVILGALIGGAFLHPTPLPSATLATNAGTVRGSLVVVADSTWFVATGPRTVRGVPDREVQSASIVSAGPAARTSTGRLVIDGVRSILNRG